ncbi:MAG: hypothetical protein ABI134_03535, partial [Byssovorax sp.]
MEALWIAGEPALAHSAVLSCQENRNPDVPASDFERFWRPLFWKQDAEHGLTLNVRFAESRRASVELRKSQVQSLFINDKKASGPSPRASWTIDVRTEKNGQEFKDKIVGSRAGIQIPSDEGETFSGSARRRASVRRRSASSPA